MAAKKSTVNKSIDKVYAGSEPILAAILDSKDPEYGKALNWYNYVYSVDEGQPWLIQWMKLNSYPKDKIDIIKKSPAWAHGGTPCWIAKMALNGTKLHQGGIDFIDRKIDEAITRFNRVKTDEEVKAEQKQTTNVISIQDRTKAKMDQILSFAEVEVVDGYMDGAGLSMYQFLQKYSANPATANHLRAFYIRCHEEIFSGDEQVKESYGKNLKKWQTFWQTLIDDIDRYVGNKKVVKVRKPREVKAKPIAKLIEKLKFQKEDPTLKLVSALPQEIIGAKELWTYNTKDRKLTVFYATGPAGLSVKGTAIIGFDIEKSETKRLRKPEGPVGEVLKAGKVAIRKIMPELTTVGSKPNGRINTDTILLRVLK